MLIHKAVLLFVAICLSIGVYGVTESLLHASEQQRVLMYDQKQILGAIKDNGLFSHKTITVTPLEMTHNQKSRSH